MQLVNFLQQNQRNLIFLIIDDDIFHYFLFTKNLFIFYYIYKIQKKGKKVGITRDFNWEGGP